MDMELAKFLFQVLQTLLTGGIGIYVYLSNKNRVTNDRISLLQNDVDSRLDDHSERLARQEAAAEKSPTHTDLSALHEKVNAVAREVSGMAGELKGISDGMRLILSSIAGKGLK